MGLIGASLARQFKKNTPHTVAGYDISDEVMVKAELLGAIDSRFDPYSPADADIVFFALCPAAAMDMMDKWKPLCEKYNCTIANLALGWILAQGDFMNLLSGSTTAEQIEENVKSAELDLDPEDVAYMRELAEEIDK